MTICQCECEMPFIVIFMIKSCSQPNVSSASSIFFLYFSFPWIGIFSFHFVSLDGWDCYFFPFLSLSIFPSRFFVHNVLIEPLIYCDCRGKTKRSTEQKAMLYAFGYCKLKLNVDEANRKRMQTIHSMIRAMGSNGEWSFVNMSSWATNTDVITQCCVCVWFFFVVVAFRRPFLTSISIAFFIFLSIHLFYNLTLVTRPFLVCSIDEI